MIYKSGLSDKLHNIKYSLGNVLDYLIICILNIVSSLKPAFLVVIFCDS